MSAGRKHCVGLTQGAGNPINQRLRKPAGYRIIFSKQGQEGFVESFQTFPCPAVLVDAIHAIFYWNKLRESARASLARLIRKGRIIGSNFR